MNKNVKNITFYLCALFLIVLFCSRENPLFDANGIPIVLAGNDTTVSINDTIKLYGKAIDDGTIVSYEWNINGSGFIATSKIDTIIIAPSKPCSSYVCSLKVTDSQGNSATDTTNITVLLDKPSATATTTTPQVSINDSITLNGSGNDIYGRIVKWEWDEGNTGLFKETSPSSNLSAIGPSSPDSSFMCVLRVTDDDGNIVSDTVKIDVVLDAPLVTASAQSNTVTYKDIINLSGTIISRSLKTHFLQ